MKKLSPWVHTCAATVLGCCLTVLPARLLLRSLYRLLAFDAAFSDIFRQIATARMAAPALLTAAAVLGALLLLKRLPPAAAWPLGVLLWILITALTVCFTRVNGIVFWDVLTALIPLLKGGVL